MSGSRLYANNGDGIEITGNAGATITDSEIFGNIEFGVRNGSSVEVEAQDNWWGSVDGPGGEGPGSGDGISGLVDIDGLLGNDFKTDGTEFSYFDAGPNTSRGGLAGPVVAQGTFTDEWGTTPATDMLYDVNRVIVDYMGLDDSQQYQVLLNYYNPDDTTATGGSVQRLTDTNEVVVHDGQLVSRTNPTASLHKLNQASYASGNLRLNVVRENGLRATVSQIWLFERAGTDNTPPVSAIAVPGNNQYIGGALFAITGTASDTESDVQSVAVGIDAGTGIDWRPVSQLRTDGSWRYNWNLPGDGSYQLYARATDSVGNVETPTAAITVIVDQTAPVAVTNFYGFDTPSDNGGSISLNWDLSSDDGMGANDVVNYQVQRRLSSGGILA